MELTSEQLPKISGIYAGRVGADGTPPLSGEGYKALARILIKGMKITS